MSYPKSRNGEETKGVVDRCGTALGAGGRAFKSPRPDQSSEAKRIMVRKTLNSKRTRPACPPEYSEDGVDLTLIRWMLSLTPSERLRAVQSNARSLMRLRGGRTKP
jgi:hypothetical protein